MAKYLVLFFVSFWHVISYANDECANAVELIPGTSCSYTTGTFSGTTMSSAVPSCGTESLQDVWYKFTATDATMSISLGAQSGLNHGFEVMQGGCSGTVVNCTNSYFAGSGEYYFNNDFVLGQVYYVRVFNATAQFGTNSFSICIRKYPSPANDACTGASVLTPNATCSYTYGTFSGAMMNGGVPSCATGSLQDVWYKFTATDATMSISLSSESGLNHGFEIIQGGCSGTVLQCINASGTGFSEYYFNNNFIPGQEYYVRVFNVIAQLNTSTFGICVTKYPSPANDACASALALIPNNTCSYTYGTFSGAMMNGATPSCATGTSQDAWYKFTATDVTMSIALGSESGLNHGFEIIQGGCNGTVLQCINASGAGFSEYYFNNNFVPGQEYYVRVFNASGNLNTNTFGICITKYPSPANDACASALALIPNNTCSYTYGTFSGAMMNGATPSCATGTSQDTWYKFTATDVTMSIALGSESGLNHGFEIIQGGCSGTVLQCINASSAGFSEYYFNNNFVPGQEYYVRVFNASGNLNTSTFGICVTKYPSPANDACASALALIPNNTCSYTYGTFSGAMMNGATPSCATGTSQDTWYKFTATDVTMSIALGSESGLNHGFEIIQGGCSGTVLQCINASSAGFSEYYFNNNFVPGQEYYVRVFNASGNLNTSTFGICITKYPSPANDVCANALALIPNNTCSYTYGTFSGAMMNGATPSCATGTSQDTWYKFTATDVTMSIALGSESGLNHGFEIIQGGCSGTVLQCINASSAGFSEYYFNNNFVPGQEYYVRVFNASGNLNTSTFGICITKYPSPANDLCTNAIELTPSAACSYTYGTFSGATLDGGTASCATGASQDVWYKFVATTSNAGIILNSVSGLNHGFQVLEGSCNGTQIICVNGSGAGFSESTSLTTLTPGTTYYIRAFNVSGNLNTQTFGICLTGTPPAACTPSVTITASATTICQGESVTFNASPTYGGTAPSYQWKVNGSNVGTNSSSYTTTSLTNGSSVTCVMTSNATCAATTTATSNAITMVVSTPTVPAFTQIASICSGGSFTLPATSSNGVSGTWSPAVNNTAITTYTFTPNAGQCASTATMTVTVNNITTPTFTQIAAICSGGSFTLPATSTNGISGAWSPAINNTATTTYTFTPNTGQCATTTTMTVTVNSTPATPAFTQVTAICSGGAFSLPTTSTNGISGTWSPAINNTATTTYTFTPNAGQCASTASMTVTVNSNVTPVFTQIAAICTGGSFSLPATSNNGISGTWSPAINNTSTTTYTFTPNTGQCATTATMTVAVNSTTPTFTQIAAICQGGTFTLPATSNNGISGSWSPAINNTATTTYTFTPNTGQCATTATMTVAVNSTTPTFTQIAAICPGGSFTLPATSNNGISGTWSPAVNNAATTTYTFTPNTGQCATTATMTVTVNSTSITPSFVQVEDICSGETFSLPATSNNGISGTWSPAVNNTATTTYTFTPNAGQCALTTTMTVTVNSSLVPTFFQIPAVCEGELFILPTISNNAILGTWSPAANSMTTTTYTFTAEPGFDECVQTVSMTVVVNSVNAGTTVQGNTITASASGATYQWINCANNQPISGATGASFTPTANGSYAVTVTQNGCSETSGCTTINTLGVETLLQTGWNVYPNPATDQLFIELDEATDIVIMDLAGKTIQRAGLIPGNNAVNVSALTPGVYFIQSGSGANVKFVKK